MTLQQLHQVITIAESRSMNEASRKLFVSQPNLSAVVRELEEEAGITIFIRSNRGIVLTLEGEEFIGYAKQVVEQYHLLESRYISSASKKKFSVSMQHYTFAVKAFVEVVKAVGMEEYEFAVHETQTNQVIENVRNMKSELGILFLSKFNEAVLQKLFKENDVIFEELFTCDTYVYLWKGHPLAQRDVISMKELQEYPCLVFEQGKNNSFYFAEEMKSTYEYKKMIHADDRATMLNLMVGLNGYTLCSGIICEELNGNDYAAVPLAESEKMRIGYIRHKGIKVSPIGELYVDILKKSSSSHQNKFYIEVNRAACVVTIYMYNDETNKYDIPVKTCSVCVGSDIWTVAGTGGLHEKSAYTPIGTYSVCTNGQSVKYTMKPMHEPDGSTVYARWATHIVGNVYFHSIAVGTQSHYALPAVTYNKLGRPASAGCIRMAVADAKWIYDYTSTGNTIKIVKGSTKKPGPLGKAKTIKVKGGINYDPTDPGVPDSRKKKDYKAKRISGYLTKKGKKIGY